MKVVPFARGAVKKKDKGMARSRNTISVMDFVCLKPASEGSSVISSSLHLQGYFCTAPLHWLIDGLSSLPVGKSETGFLADVPQYPGYYLQALSIHMHTPLHIYIYTYTASIITNIANIWQLKI